MKCEHPFELDHIVIGAQSLQAGIDYVADRLGVQPSLGGKHPGLGTHNAVVNLLRRRYLEIIAIDPDAPPPERTRWFGLDEPAVQAALESGPKLLAYVVRSATIPHDLRHFPKLDPQPATRGDFSWTFGFTQDGRRPGMGALPYFIAWDEHSAHPTERLPAPHWDLLTIEIGLPCAPNVQMVMQPLQLPEITFTDATQFSVRAHLRAGNRQLTL